MSDIFDCMIDEIQGESGLKLGKDIMKQSCRTRCNDYNRYMQEAFQDKDENLAGRYYNQKNHLRFVFDCIDKEDYKELWTMGECPKNFGLQRTGCIVSNGETLCCLCWERAMTSMYEG